MEDDNSLTSNTGGPTTPTKNRQPRAVIDIKMSSIYNRTAPEAPAELFRKDLISAIKLPDSEPLAADEYWVINDQWKQEWERGVQVPINPDSLPEPSVNSLQQKHYKKRQDFKLPKNKYIRITKDESFSHDQLYLSNTPAISEQVCYNDLCDEAWLKVFNGERNLSGLVPVTDEQFERVVEELEVRCWDKIQAIMKSEEGLGIEYDENVICDVCRSPDSEKANEMVFCSEPITKISSIPSSRWALICVLCRELVGACIKCSVKTCKTAYHVTCAFQHGLEMRAIIEDGVKLRSYCQKHGTNKSKRDNKNSNNNAGSGTEEEGSTTTTAAGIGAGGEMKRKMRKDMTSEENKNQQPAAKSAAATTNKHPESNNPYKRTYINGAARRSMSDISSESDTHSRRNMSTSASSAHEEPIKKSSPAAATSATASQKKKTRQTKAADRKRRKVSSSAEKNRTHSMESSSEDEVIERLKGPAATTASTSTADSKKGNQLARNASLRQMERELADDRMHLSDSNDSDEIVPIVSRSGSGHQLKKTLLK